MLLPPTRAVAVACPQRLARQRLGCGLERGEPKAKPSRQGALTHGFALAILTAPTFQASGEDSVDTMAVFAKQGAFFTWLKYK